MQFGSSRAAYIPQPDGRVSLSEQGLQPYLASHTGTIN